MKVGDEVQILSGKDAGAVGTISFAYPGGGGCHFFRVKLSPIRTIEATAKRLRLIHPAAA